MSADSDRLFGHLAAHYDDHFAVGHRRAYDELSWDLTLSRLPPPPATVIDVGCGVGRWARALVDRGYTVIGIEPAPPMAAEAVHRVPEMRVLSAPAETAVLPAGAADAVLAMGSLQYADDAPRAFANVARWLRPGGWFCVLVDSRQALGLELLRADRPEEAYRRLDSGRGRWVLGRESAELRLYDVASLRAELLAAGLDVVSLHGLLVGATIWGRPELAARLNDDWAGQLTLERQFAGRPELADLGKQLFAVARKPVPDPARPQPARRPRP